MKNVNSKFVLVLMTILFLFGFINPAFCAKTQFTPTVSITEKWTDNYDQTQNNKNDEFSTHYNLGLKFSIVEKMNSFSVEYNPRYSDYMTENDQDAWHHNALLNATYLPSKNTRLNFSDTFNRSLDRSDRTNNFEKHDTNMTQASFRQQFGEKDNYTIGYSYSFDDYENPNQDAFKTHNPHASLSYWFTPHFGMDFNGSYSDTEYDISSDGPETISGDIRFIKNMNEHFDAYVKYAHTLTDRSSGNHVVYNPSIGFDWEVSEDSGVSLGVGVLFQDYENRSGYASEQLFLDFDIYKNISFSRRNDLAITGSSSYGDIDPSASSLGFTITNQVGILHTYKLTKRLSSELRGSYVLKNYDEPGVDRKDNTLNLGAGLNWTPLKWLKLNMSYGFKDYNTDSSRQDYQEQTASFTISLIPSSPVDLKPSEARQILEDKIFN